MTDDERSEIDRLHRLVKEMENKIARIMPHLWTREKEGGSAGGGELVALTPSGTSPSFTYAFTDSDGNAQTAIVPANSGDRQDVDLLAAGFGIWFKDGAGGGDLYVIEPIDWSTCDSTPGDGGSP